MLLHPLPLRSPNQGLLPSVLVPRNQGAYKKHCAFQEWHGVHGVQEVVVERRPKDSLARNLLGLLQKCGALVRRRDCHELAVAEAQ